MWNKVKNNIFDKKVGQMFQCNRSVIQKRISLSLSINIENRILTNETNLKLILYRDFKGDQDSDSGLG